MIVLQGFVDRLNRYLRVNGMTNTEFSKKLECSSTYISYLLSHKRNPSQQFLEKLAKISDKSVTWWIHGEEEYKGLMALDELLDLLIKNKIIKSIEDYEANLEIEEIIQSMIKAEIRIKLEKKDF